MTIHSLINAALAVAAITLISGCQSQLGYANPQEARIISTNVGAYDLQQHAVTMVDSLLSNPVLNRKLREQFPDGKRPVISVQPLINDTRQLNLKLDAITNSISTRLINSDKFEFMDLPANNEVYVQIISDITSGIGNDARKAQLIGMQDRPDYILVGQLQEISESNDRVKDSFYKLTMRLVNLQTFKFDWAEENDIRKVQTRARFGY
ncbi:MAG: hypothetical protein PHY82_01060 [Lentisphaeria bacterium]|jgi:uncharacterized protein (TIGR02722 family)|nr:hypothetical protein [Lentisphaeria bacterium]